MATGAPDSRDTRLIGRRFCGETHPAQAFKVEVLTEQAKAQVKIELNEAAWTRRRRFDGFSLIVAHPAIDLSAAKIARLYREKNAIEFDFRTIKSQIELRPIRHFTDCKVTAHVTICMLALALERHLQQKLGTKTMCRNRACYTSDMSAQSLRS